MCTTALCAKITSTPGTGTVTITQVLYVLDPVVTDFLVLVKYCDLKTTRYPCIILSSRFILTSWQVNQPKVFTVRFLNYEI